MTVGEDTPLGDGGRLFDDEEAPAPSSRRGGTKSGASDEERALAMALRHLNRRERTTAELTLYLAAKGFDEGIVATTVARLHEDGYVDDGRYARLFVEDKRNLESWGRERIVRALRERGLERQTIDVALAQYHAGEPETETERALAVLARRFPEPPRDRRERERAFAVLVRKGYDSEVALAALRAHADAA